MHKKAHIQNIIQASRTLLAHGKLLSSIYKYIYNMQKHFA